jgi:hypothetical protein
MRTVTMRTEATVEVDLDMLARLFAELDDDAQAQFFVKVAAILDATPPTKWTSDVARWQAEHIGRHLAECSCSTVSGRLFIGRGAHAVSGQFKDIPCPKCSGAGTVRVRVAVPKVWPQWSVTECVCPFDPSHRAERHTRLRNPRHPYTETFELCGKCEKMGDTRKRFIPRPAGDEKR